MSSVPGCILSPLLAKLKYIALFLLGLYLCHSAFAQGRGEADALLRDWTAKQVQASEAVRLLSYEEKTTREVDGPFGRRSTYLRARITGEPLGDEWRRDVLEARANDVRLSADEYERLEGSGGMKDDRWLRAYVLGPRLLARMRPAGAVAPDRIGRTRTLRFDLVPPARSRLPVRRITVWLDQDGTRLLQTRAVMDRPNRAGTFVVTTLYRRVNGLDVPVRRSAEGTYRTKRRLRTFTMLMRVESEFSDYRMERP